MPKYIDADALLIAENDTYWEKYTNGGTVEADDIIHIALSKILGDAPAANVAPITLAKWLTWEEKFQVEKPPINDRFGVFCTACGLHADNSFAYCPSCGAKMENGFEVERC